VLSLFFFGGSAIHDFSFALLIGLLVGAYSSIFVAAPMLSIKWKTSP
jgi:SecD/SecF fusion protein